MISGFEVGSVFRIIDQASPALRRILLQVRELQVAMDKARESMAFISRGMTSGLGGAVTETGALANAWREVAAASALATRNMTAASAAGRNSTAAAAAVGGGGNRFRPRAGLPHIGGGSIPHMSGGVGLAAGGLALNAVYQAAEMERAEWWLTYHSHLAQSNENHAKFRKILQDSMATTGFGLKESAEAALQETRMFQATPTGGVGALRAMMSIASKEALSKGSGLKESMDSFIGLAHMTGSYTDSDVEKLAPAFAALSTADPRSLTAITRAAGYSVPLLHSGLDIDPLTTLALGTALARAGALSTRSGTWTREMMVKAMPGTNVMSRTAFNKHESALRALGLVDKHHHPTWFTDGKPDPLKMLDMAGSKLPGIPLTQRAAIERSLFGVQGSEGFAMLSNPTVLDQVHRLRGMMDDPTVKNHYDSLLPDFAKGSTIQQARTTLAEFNNLSVDIGQKSLPAFNDALRDMKNILAVIRGTNDREAKPKWGIGGTAIEGAAIGAVTGAFMGGVGAVPGSLIGGVTGAAYGAAHDWGVLDLLKRREKPEDRYHERLDRLERGNRQSAAPAIPNVTMQLNVDGRTLAEAVMRAGAPEFPIQAPSFDGMGIPSSGDHNYSDK